MANTNGPAYWLKKIYLAVSGGVAPINTGTPSEPTPIAVATTTTDVLAANASRKYLQLINDSDTTIYVSIDGGNAVLNTGTRLNANGGSAVWDTYIPVGTVKAIHGSTGTKTLLVTEG